MPGQRTHLRNKPFDEPYRFNNIYVMQRKLTLRMDDAIIRKAKRLARQRGQSVSRLVSDYVTHASEENSPSLPPQTAAMVGILDSSTRLTEKDYRKQLEDKHL